MYLLLRADQRLKQNHKDEILSAHPQELYPSGKESGLMLSQKIILQSITQFQNNWVLVFVMVIYLEKTMERLNSGEWRNIFGTILNDLNVGLVKSGRVHWKKGGGNKKRFQCCTDPSGQEILYLRALQGHSGRSLIDPSLQDNVLIPKDFFEYIYHIGCAINLHSIMNSGLIPGGQKLSKRQTVFFTSVDPVNKEHKDPDEIDLECTASCLTQAKSMEETSKHCVFWHQICSKERINVSSIKHDRTQSSFTTRFQLAYCIPKAIMMKSGEVKNEKVHVSLLPRKISFKDNWMKELGSEVAGGGKDSQQTQPKTKNPIVRTGRLVLSEQQSGSSVQEIENVSNVTAKAPMKEQGDLFSSCLPVSVERSDQDKDADENVDADQIRMVRPVKSEQSIGLFTQCEDMDIDFKVSGLPHAVVKQAENFRVRELVKKIQSHPHPRVLQADLKQKQHLQPIQWRIESDDSWNMGNVELFELCETIPKVQCSECLLSWNQGIVYCTCGPLLKESEASQHFHQWRLDAFSIENYVIRKGRLRGARHGTTEAFHSPQCSKEMSQKEIWRNSRSLPRRLNISWFAAQNWLDWRNVHCDGQISTGRPLLLSIAWRVRQISEELIYHTEQIRKKCTNETPIRFPRSTHKNAPSPPWIWRRATWTNSFLSIPKVAFVVFFIQYLMLAVERTLVELIN